MLGYFSHKNLNEDFCPSKTPDNGQKNFPEDNIIDFKILKSDNYLQKCESIFSDKRVSEKLHFYPD